MAGRGPFPKRADQRAWRNSSDAVVRLVPATASPQPSLPVFYREVESEKKRFMWPKATRQWWEMLSAHPLVDEFTDVDWSYLLDTALIHAQFWSGDVKLAGELRLREAKYGFTPEDRARLRMSFTLATGVEADTATKVDRAVSAWERMRGVTRKDTA